MDLGRSIINVWDWVGNRNKPRQQTGLRIQRLMLAVHLTDPIYFIIDKFFNISLRQVSINLIRVEQRNFYRKSKRFIFAINSPKIWQTLTCPKLKHKTVNKIKNGLILPPRWSKTSIARKQKVSKKTSHHKPLLKNCSKYTYTVYKIKCNYNTPICI